MVLFQRLQILELSLAHKSHPVDYLFKNISLSETPCESRWIFNALCSSSLEDNCASSHRGTIYFQPQLNYCVKPHYWRYPHAIEMADAVIFPSKDPPEALLEGFGQFRRVVHHWRLGVTNGKCQSYSMCDVLVTDVLGARLLLYDAL